MVLDNLHVRHKAFGDGVVVATQGKYMTVKFGSAEKIFVYPDIFEKFLTLSDGTVSDDIKEDIRLTNVQKQAVLDRKNEENQRAMTRGIVIPGKENSGFETEEEEGRSASSENEEI